MAKPVGYLPTLDGWRAAAILAVIFDHATLPGWMVARLPHWLMVVKAGSGEKGVQLFFAISGFLITSRLIEEWNCTGQISLKRFYVRRVCRILPPAMTYLLVVGALALVGILSVNWKCWLSAVCFFRNYMPVYASGLDTHYWSLSLEEQFYLIWPALLVLSGLSRSKRTALAMICGVVLWRWVAYHHIWGVTLRLGEFWRRSDICFDGLLFGCLFALMLESPKVRNFLTAHLQVWAVAVIMILILATAGHTNTPSARTVQSALMPFLIVATILNPRTWLGRLLEISPLRWVGRLSYSLYIWQQLFVYNRLFPWLWLQLAGLFAVVLLSFYFIEKPMIKLGYKLASPPSLGHQDLAPIPERS